MGGAVLKLNCAAVNDLGRVFLPRYPMGDLNSDYINAVYVDGFRLKNQFIVTQMPLPNTVQDFWRMIFHTKSQIIVSLNDIPNDDDTCCEFWPKDQEVLNLSSAGIILKCYKVECCEVFDVHSLQIMDTREDDCDKLTVKIIQFKNWTKNVKVPTNLNDFINLCLEFEAISRGKHPVTVMCYDGVTASGIFVAFAFVAEKMKLEQLCDVYQATHIIRKNRTQFISDKAQLKFLYVAAVMYMKQFDTYDNFQQVLS